MIARKSLSAKNNDLRALRYGTVLPDLADLQDASFEDPFPAGDRHLRRR